MNSEATMNSEHLELMASFFLGGRLLATSRWATCGGRLTLDLGFVATVDSGPLRRFRFSFDPRWDPLSISEYFARLWPLRRRNNVISTQYSRNRAASWDEGRGFLLEINALEAVFCAVSRSPSQRKRIFKWLMQLSRK
jgi:hypothetical protein